MIAAIAAAALPALTANLALEVAPVRVNLIANTALTGATYDIDGGEQIAVRA